MTSETPINLVDILKFNGEDNFKVISDINFNSEILLDENITQWDSIIFNNCIFKENLVFYNIKITSKLIFKYCIFEKNLTFENVEIKNLYEFIEDDILFKDNDFSLEFSNCTINDFSIIPQQGPDLQYSFIEGGLSFHSNTQIESFSCQFCEFQKNGISFSSVIIKNHFSVSEIENIEYINLDTNCIIKSDLYLNSLVIDEIYFNNSTFEGSITIEDISVVNKFKLFGSTFHKEISISQGKYISENPSGLLNISKSIFLKNFYVVYNYRDEFIEQISEDFKTYPNGFKKVHINSSSFEERFQLSSYSSVGEDYIQDLKIRLSSLLKGHIFISNLNIKKCSLTGDNLNHHITFSKIKFDRLSFLNFNNYGKISLNQCKGSNKGSFLVKDSSLGNLKLLNFDFNTFKNTIISNSVIQEVMYTNVVWFNEKIFNNNLSKKPKDSNYFRNNREIFKQLKFLTEKQLDKFQSLRFQQLEMSAYKNELKSIDSSWEDRFIMWANSINNFGQSWAKPALYALISTIISWLLITSSLFYDINILLFFSPIDLDSMTKNYILNIKNIFPMMNPIYNLKIIYNNTEPNFITNLIEFAHKLILSFFLFQTITAFRKYVKQ